MVNARVRTASPYIYGMSGGIPTRSLMRATSSGPAAWGIAAAEDRHLRRCLQQRVDVCSYGGAWITDALQGRRRREEWRGITRREPGSGLSSPAVEAPVPRAVAGRGEYL